MMVKNLSLPSTTGSAGAEGRFCGHMPKLFFCTCFREINPFLWSKGKTDPQKARSLWRRKRERAVFTSFHHRCKQTFGVSLFTASSIHAVCLTDGNTSAVSRRIHLSCPVLTMLTHARVWRNLFSLHGSSLLAVPDRMAMRI